VHRVLVPAVAALLLAGCSHVDPLTPGPGLTVVDMSELPAPVDQDMSRGYPIGALDKLAISVFGIEELTRDVSVDAAGRIALPLVGSMEARGKTPAELSATIAAALRGKYVRDPQVAVNVEETNSQVITVDGQVTQPGLYPVVNNMTLTKAVASAKGAAEFAKLEDVVVFRTVGGQRMAALYNLAAIRRGAYPDPRVYANDVIEVGDSPGRRRFRDILTVSPLLLAPLIAVINSGGV
jgi:polysaccharide export outer membrane protein